MPGGLIAVAVASHWSFIIRRKTLTTGIVSNELVLRSHADKTSACTEDNKNRFPNSESTLCVCADVCFGSFETAPASWLGRHPDMVADTGTSTNIAAMLENNRWPCRGRSAGNGPNSPHAIRRS